MSKTFILKEKIGYVDHKKRIKDTTSSIPKEPKVLSCKWSKFNKIYKIFLERPSNFKIKMNARDGCIEQF